MNNEPSTSLSIMDLRDIVSPEPVSFWPPAPFVGILMCLIIILLAMLIWRRMVRWKADAYRREGLASLSRIERQFMNPGKEISALQELSVLMKKVALAAFPRKKVASLSGDAWLRFLDRTCKGCAFASGPGQLLSAVVLAGKTNVPISTGDGKQLLRLAGIWIKGHRS